jgi:hypothetical protein
LHFQAKESFALQVWDHPVIDFVDLDLVWPAGDGSRGFVEQVFNCACQLRQLHVIWDAYHLDFHIFSFLGGLLA